MVSDAILANDLRFFIFSAATAMKRKHPGAALFGPLRLLIRLLIAAFVVFAIYNPSGRSYYHWVTEPESGPLPLQIGMGLILVAAIALFVRLGTASFGRLRFFIGIFVIILFGIGVRASLSQYLADIATLGVLAAWFGLGISWPFMARRLHGQLQSRKV